MFHCCLIELVPTADSNGFAILDPEEGFGSMRTYSSFRLDHEMGSQISTSRTWFGSWFWSWFGLPRTGFPVLYYYLCLKTCRSFALTVTQWPTMTYSTWYAYHIIMILWHRRAKMGHVLTLPVICVYTLNDRLEVSWKYYLEKAHDFLTVCKDVGARRGALESGKGYIRSHEYIAGHH